MKVYFWLMLSVPKMDVPMKAMDLSLIQAPLIMLNWLLKMNDTVNECIAVYDCSTGQKYQL